jgi:hypothetical protein
VSAPTDRTILLHLLRGAVPERADEISRLWNQYGPAVEVVPSGSGVTMDADEKRIRIDPKTIDCFWLLGFSLWHAIEVYAPALAIVTSSGITLDIALGVDSERGQYEFDFKQRINAARSLIAAQHTEHISWPDDLPKPTADREGLRDVQHMAAFDLVSLALAFALLHEFQHVIFCADKSAPSELPEEEIACDAYARDFMTSGLAAYAAKHGHSFTQVLQKRASGIAVAAAIIHIITPTHAHWGNRQYPPIAARLTALIGGYPLRDDSPFWTFTACLLIALLRQDNRGLSIAARSDREMVEMLLGQFH